MKLKINKALHILDSKITALSKREKILLLILCFLLPFLLIFWLTFEQSKAKISLVESQKIELIKRVDTLKNIEHRKDFKDLEILKEQIKILEKEKDILEQSLAKNIYENADFLDIENLAKSFSLKDFSIQKEQNGFIFYGLGNFKDFYQILGNFDSCFKDLAIINFSVYPNAKDLEFYIHLQKEKNL